MINELYNLHRTLERTGIETYDWYREYKPLPSVTANAPLVRIWLDDDGEVCDLESLGAEQADKLRKYGNNQNYFPAFNITTLYRITDKEHIKTIEGYEKSIDKADLDRVRSLCTEDNWNNNMLKQVQRCLINCPNNMLEFIGESESVSQSIIARLIELCVKSSSLDGGFRASLEKCIFRKLKNDEDVALLLKLLFNKGNAQKERDKDVGNKISVILDVHNWQQYINPVASEATTIWLNRLLMESDAGRRTTNDCSTAIDAFGDSFVDLNEPMPSVRIKGNEVILRTMYESYPCQYRYRRINDGSYPISADNRSAVKKAFEWIAEPSRKHITWTQVNKKEFAFVYPNKLPKVSPRYASVFGIWQGESSASATARFEAVAGEFTKVFHGLPSREKPSAMRIFTIKKVDRARSKVVFTHNTTPEQLIDAADNWSCSCKNVPRLDTGANIAPFPLEVADTVNAVWKQNGERKDGKEPVIQMKHYQGIELLLGLLPESAERKLLHA